MSYFTKFVLHPAVNALAQLAAHPAIAANSSAQAAVADAQKTATEIAATVTSAAHQVEATATAQAQPILADLTGALQTAIDAYLLSFGPLGALEVPVANAVIAMGEQYVQTYVAALFGHARTASAEAVALKGDPAPAGGAA